MTSATLARVEAHVFRTPIKEPVRTSFGTMTERAAAFVRVEDSDGAHGWGEIWCNFPNPSAEYRARLFTEIVASRALGRTLDDPVALWNEIDRALHVLRIQSADFGGFFSAAAGLDMAIHDLRARKQGVPLWQALGGVDGSPVRVYASGINPGANTVETIERMRGTGYRAFKIKVGFGETTDLASLRPAAANLKLGERLMVDANQAWDLATAKAMAARLAEFSLRWIEEPLMADRPAGEWAELAAAAPAPLAAGENMRGAGQFEEAIGSGLFGVLQPDLAKWGGHSGCLPVAQAGAKRLLDSLSISSWHIPHSPKIDLGVSVPLNSSLGESGSGERLRVST